MKRITVKEEVCLGCHLCEVYCRVAHSQTKDVLKTYKKESRTLPRVRIEERKPVSFSLRCHHCDNPPCVYACLTGALKKDAESGIVTVDEARCMGCWTCVLACPYGAVLPDRLRGKAVKCDLCLGSAEPACVANCPNEALVYTDGRDS